MPYTYEDTLQGERRNALTVPSARSDVLTEQFAISFEENPIMALRRFSALAEDQVTGPRLSAETARARLADAGMENDIAVAAGGITEAALLTLMDRKRVEKRRQEIFARSEGGLAEGAARFGVAAATALSDPIGGALNFVPVVGQAKYARWLSAARGLGGRVAVRAAVGAAEGAAGAAIAEIPIYAMRTQEQADYDMVDSLLNVAFGGVIGSGLHTTVGSAAEVISRRLPRAASRETPPARIEPTISEPARAVESLPDDIQRAIFQPGIEGTVERMPSMARTNVLREAVAQAAEGHSVDVQHIVDTLDPASAPEFRQWFTDSRAVDASGAPVLVHLRPFQNLDNVPPGGSLLVSTERSGDESMSGYILARNPATLAEVEQVRRSLANRLLPRGAGDALLMAATFTRDHSVSSAELVSGLQARGFDSIHEPGSSQWQVFNPAQIRPAVQRRTVAPTRDRTQALQEEVDWVAAQNHADETLSRSREETPEAALNLAEEEASLAMADANELAKRVGVDVRSDPDFATAMEDAEKAERWARVAELATVCLVRGG